MGRPTELTQSKQDDICDWIANGSSLVSWCKANDFHYATIMRHLSENKGFSDNYARARADQAHKLAEEIIAISDDGTNDTYVTDQGVSVNHDHIARSRLRVDSRKWYASKLLPKKYGEKLELDGGLAVRKDASELSDNDLADIILRRNQDRRAGEVSENTGLDREKP